MADAKISALTNYTSSIDTDVLPIVDVTAGVTKKITHANMMKNINDVQLNTSPTIAGHTEGRLFYDASYKTLSVNIDTDVTLQAGQEELIRVHNATGSQINNGQVVYTNGVSNGWYSVALAKADSYATSFTLGVATQNIPDGEEGFVTVRGEVHDLDTTGTPVSETWNVGDVLYLSSTTAGAMTNVVPTGTAIEARIGRVLAKNATTGEIQVNQLRATRVTDLADATVTNPQVDEVLRYNGSEWINGSPTSASASPGIMFYNTTPVINSRTSPSGLKQDGTAGNGIKINSLSKTPVTTVTGTVTISQASPAVVTWTSHGLPIGAPVVFTTDGALPAPLVAGTTYYIISAGYGTNSFEISATSGGAAINTTNAGSGTHTGTATELTVSGLASSDTRPIAAWLYNTALGRTTIDAGVWNFTVYCAVDNAAGTTTLTRAIYQVVPVSSGTVTTSGAGANSRTATITSGQFSGTYFNANATNTAASWLQTPSGMYQITSISNTNTATITVPTGYSNENAVTFNIWNKLLSATSASIETTGTNYAINQFQTTAPAFTVALTDKLGAISFETASNANITLTMAFNGTQHNSNFETPLITLHNNLAGLNAGDYVHLTAAQASPIINAQTSGKILKSNGTIMAASTETYAAPGTSGNVMTSDGTNWTSAAPAVPPNILIANNATGGIKITLTSTETQIVGDACQIDANGKAHLAKADAIANASVIVMSASTVTGSASNTYITQGVVKLASSPSWTVGGTVYLSTTGTSGNTLTQTAPSGANNVIQPLGVAIAADTMIFNSSLVQVEHV